MPLHDHCFQVVRSYLKAYGVGAALAELNRSVPHRFSAIFECRDDLLVCLHLHDKQGVYGPGQMECCEHADRFCANLIKTDGAGGRPPFSGPLLYHAVALTGVTGALAGTLCHFDVENHGISDGELETMQRVARLLPSFIRWQQ